MSNYCTTNMPESGNVNVAFGLARILTYRQPRLLWPFSHNFGARVLFKRHTPPGNHGAESLSKGFFENAGFEKKRVQKSRRQGYYFIEACLF